MQVEAFVIAFVIAIGLAAATVYTWVASVVSKNTHNNVDKYSILPSASGIRSK